jgi:spore coat-associated protein N
MQRVSALWQASPRKVVGALFILMMAAMMAVASGASFTSSTPNTGNVVAAGIMKIDTDKSGGAILNIHGLVPGHSDSGTVTLSNTGDADGVLTLSKSNVVNSSTPGLSGKLLVDIVDQSNGSSVYSGTLGSMPSVAAGSLAKGASKTYKFTVSFPDGGVPSSPTSGDNVYQNQSVSVDYAWDAVSQ